MIPFEYQKPTTTSAAITARGKYANASFLAGGTNLVDLMKNGVSTPSRIIDINGLPLDAIDITATGIRLGALATNSSVARHNLVKNHFPLLAMAINAGASPQLRNMATVGGNIMQRTRCSYFYDTALPCNKRKPGSGCGAIGGYNRMHAIFGTSSACIAVHPSDMCVALAALDATINVEGPKGIRQITFADFHRLPSQTPEIEHNLLKNELILSVDIPFNTWASHSFYNKIRDRASYAFALVSVAAALDIKDNEITAARLVLGGVAPKPWRLGEVEKLLVGQRPSETIFKEAGALAVQGAVGYGHNNFKLKLVPGAILEALKSAANF